ncbi:MAG: amidase, partial [Ruminococcaceae bacterium]|nr:amidase [Oscillospiraceae bacterium]
MLVTMTYDREKALEYARRWAFGRNPLFENYSGIGGDCTNFVSQCIYAGSCVMNYTPTFGWYYISPTNRAPAWTGVQFFYNFITSNKEVGPYGREASAGELEIGDVIQLGNAAGMYYHTL